MEGNGFETASMRLLVSLLDGLADTYKKSPDDTKVLADNIALAQRTSYNEVGNEILGTVRRHQKFQEDLRRVYQKCQGHMSRHTRSPLIPDLEPFATTHMFADTDIQAHYRIMPQKEDNVNSISLYTWQA